MEVDNLISSCEITDPTQKLMLAVLTDAIQCLKKEMPICTLPPYVKNRPLARERESRKAEYWFKTRDNDSPFSFENVCASLRLSPEYIRRLLFNEKVNLQET